MSETMIRELEWRRLNHLAKVKISMAEHAAWRIANAPEPSMPISIGMTPHSRMIGARIQPSPRSAFASTMRAAVVEKLDVHEACGRPVKP